MPLALTSFISSFGIAATEREGPPPPPHFVAFYVRGQAPAGFCRPLVHAGDGDAVLYGGHGAGPERPQPRPSVPPD